MVKKTVNSEERELVKAIKQLDEHMKKVADFYEPQRYYVSGFLRGIVYGLGILVAVALVVPLIITLLRSVEWIPLIGDIVVDISQRIENARMLR
jgi:hypothetical protein